jgi:hypothetical protein
MKKVLLMLVTGSLAFAVGCTNGEAQEDEGNDAVPVEIYGCTYNEGQGPGDLDAVTAKWNAWADSRGTNDYTAWTLTKFYSGENQEFDFLWVGASQTGQALGAAQDEWLTNGGEVAAEFEKLANCDGHSGFASIQFKEAAEREDMSTSVVTFSDCVIGEGKSFTNDVAPAITAWSEFRTGQGSKAGYFVLFPVYGGGGEEFDFKFVSTHANHTEQGVDFDNYDPAKARELFPQGMLECDSARVYNSTNRRRATPPE